MSSLFKLLLEDKPEGMTSFSSLGKVKRQYKGEKVGHAGTLDKFASGLMVVMVGGATKLNPIFSSFSKKYIATIKFGEETDTLDPEGEIIASADLPSHEALTSSITSFLGKQKQIPPVYSAIHIDGKRAYKEARDGKTIDMPERDIEIYDISLLDFDGKIAHVECHVSKGTYIRSLARDIALKAGSRAHLIGLRRVQIGPWSLDDREKSTKELLDMTDLLSSIELDSKKRKAIENGNISSKDFIHDSDSTKRFGYLYFGSQLFGICEKGEKVRILSRIEDGEL